MSVQKCGRKTLNKSKSFEIQLNLSSRETSISKRKVFLHHSFLKDDIDESIADKQDGFSLMIEGPPGLPM